MLKEYKSRLIKIIIIILTIVLVYIGFYKTFCTLKQTIDWNAVSSIATVIAVFVAIYIPQKDRIESSKIQLYNQRFEVYYILYKMLHDGNFSDAILLDIAEENYQKTLLQASFLVNKKDRLILDELKKYKPTANLVSQEKGKITFNLILPIAEQNKLDKLFEKYLQIGDYGIK